MAILTVQHELKVEYQANGSQWIDAGNIVIEGTHHHIIANIVLINKLPGI